MGRQGRHGDGGRAERRQGRRRRVLIAAFAGVFLAGAGGLVAVVGPGFVGDSEHSLPEGSPPEEAEYRPSERDASDSNAPSSDAAADNEPSVVVEGKPKEPDLDEFTTPTQKVVDNGDGTYTAEISNAPTRVQDGDGKWREIDGEIVTKDDGRLGAKLGVVEVTVTAQTDASRTPSAGPGRSLPRQGGNEEPLVVLPTEAGDIGLSHAAVDEVAAEVDGQDVVFVDALSGGRDLVETIGPQSVKESVVLDSAAGGGSYVVDFALPEGMSARQGEFGVEFVDDSTDESVAIYAPGTAYDARRFDEAGWDETPVLVELIGVQADTAAVRVAIDEAWLTDPARVFPVTIDPTFSTYSTTGGYLGLLGDTWIQNTNPGYGGWTHADLNVGVLNYGGLHYFRSFLYFPLDGLTNALVQSAEMTLYQRQATSCANNQITPYKITGWHSAWTTWNYQPGIVGFAGNSIPAGCGATFVSSNTTTAAKSWVNNGNPNHGIALYGTGTSTSFRQFASGDTFLAPGMHITYTKYGATYQTNLQASAWNRVAGLASQIPVTVTNTGSQTWTSDNGYGLSCHIKKNGTPIGDCPVTKLPAGTTVANGQSVTFNADVPPLDEGNYSIEWDMLHENVTWFSGRQVPTKTEALHVESSNPSSRGDSAYAEFAGDVNTATGTYFYQATDATVATIGPGLSVARSYNHRDSTIGAFGRGWSSSYEMSADIDANGDAIVRYPDGRLESYTKLANGTYAPPKGYYSTFVLNGDGTSVLTDKAQVRYEFNESGILKRIVDANARGVTLDHSDGELSQATDDASGRTVHFEWGGPGGQRHVTEVRTDPVSLGDSPPEPLTWTYDYSGDLLTRVCDPAGDCEEFSYTNDRITRVVRPRGNTATELGYDAADKVAWRKDGSGAQFSYAYTSTGTGATLEHTTVITDARSNTGTSVYNSGQQILRHIDEEGRTRSYEYNATNGYPIKDTDENGLVTTYENDARGNVVKQTDATGAVAYFTYDSKDLLIASRDPRSAGATDNTYLTTSTYDDAGNLLEETPPAPSGMKRWTYATGAEPAIGGGTIPKGLVLTYLEPKATTPVRFEYDAQGDLRRQTDPKGLVTEYEYDELGQPIEEAVVWTPPGGSEMRAVTRTRYDEHGQPIRVTEPAATNHVSGMTHQRRTATTYDPNGNVTSVTEQDVGGSAQPDPERTTTYEYDAVDREVRVTYPEGGGFMTREFDPNGNVVAVTDPLGRRTETTYTNTNRPAESVLVGGDATANPPLNLVLQRLTYDAGGRTATETDALGRTRVYEYDNEDRVTRVTLRAAGQGDVVLEEHQYDPAGLATRDVVGAGQQVTATTYYPNRLPKDVTLDPQGLNRTTTNTYDEADRVVQVTLGDGTATQTTTAEYDLETGLLVAESTESGADTWLTTRYVREARGLVVERTDPNGFTTTITYDELGRETSSMLPPVPLDGGDLERPETLKGYDTFGAPSHERDAKGNVTSTGYDLLGRHTSIIHPSYTPPGGMQAIVPTETYAYDAVGNVTSSTDRRGQSTTYAMDPQNRVTQKTNPAVAGQPPGVATYSYDRVGNQTEMTDPNGVVTSATYDSRNRKSSEAIGGATTTFGYDELGNRTLVRGPSGEEMHTVYNAAGEAISTTDPTGAVTTTSYDVGGRPLVVTDPLGRTRTYQYDLAGRNLADTQAGGGISLTTTYSYDNNGNTTSSTTPAGHQTTYTYDAADRLVTVTEPLEIVTRYGYDLNGNVTRLTDGNGNTTDLTYNPWDLVETRTEPPTPGQEGITDRQWVNSYDSGGLLVTEREPGGVVVTRAFDELGRMTGASGSGGDAPSATEAFGYDPGGRQTSVSHPQGAISMSYDGRNQLASTSGPAGASSFVYDSSGHLVSRTDAAGTTAFTWNARGDLTSATDQLTGVRREHTFDAAGQLTNTVYQGPNGTTEAITYDGVGRLSSETLTVNGAVHYQAGYSYDLDSQLTAETIGPAGVAGAGTHAYAFDAAGRLATWTDPAGVITGYTWDNAGNRSQAGAATFTHDARNRLTSATFPAEVAPTTTTEAPTTTTEASTTTTEAPTTTTTDPAATTTTTEVPTSTTADPGASTTTTEAPTTTTETSTTTTSPPTTTTTQAPPTPTTSPPPTGTYTYSWTPRGTLASESNGATTTTYAFDALARLSQAGDTTYTYDGLDRIATRNSAGFMYAGKELDPVSDSTFTYARSPDNEVLALDNITNPEPALLAGDDRHGDLAYLFSDDGTITDTYAFEPFGSPIASSGETDPTIGFQSDWTDPTTGDVWMGARWYAPEVDTFTSRDDVTEQLRSPISLNRYTYAQDNPVEYFDPDGHFSYRLRRLAEQNQRKEAAAWQRLQAQQQRADAASRRYQAAVWRALQADQQRKQAIAWRAMQAQQRYQGAVWRAYQAVEQRKQATAWRAMQAQQRYQGAVWRAYQGVEQRKQATAWRAAAASQRYQAAVWRALAAQQQTKQAADWRALAARPARQEPPVSGRCEFPGKCVYTVTRDATAALNAAYDLSTAVRGRPATKKQFVSDLCGGPVGEQISVAGAGCSTILRSPGGRLIGSIQTAAANERCLSLTVPLSYKEAAIAVVSGRAAAVRSALDRGTWGRKTC